jgi:hypothetical protein
METIPALKRKCLGCASVGLKQIFRMPSMILSYDSDLYMGFGWKLDSYDTELSYLQMITALYKSLQ